jgi:hypothetical protein|nr:hypothetical protein [Phenylobacterium sp.]
MTHRRIEVAGHPALAARVRMKPFPFEVAGHGAFEVSLGDVHLHFDEIPIHVRVPFLSRRVLAGSVGPFGVRMKPVEARVRAAEVVTRGVMGGEESGVDLHLDGACGASVEIRDDSSDEKAE